QEPVGRQELPPLAIEQYAVCLESVMNRPPVGESFLQRDRAPKEIHPHQRRLAPLPCEVNLRRVLTLDDLTNVRLQHLVAHAEPRRRGDNGLLLQIEAVLAIQVADRPAGLGHQMEGFLAGHVVPSFRKLTPAPFASIPTRSTDFLPAIVPTGAARRRLSLFTLHTSIWRAQQDSNLR